MKQSLMPDHAPDDRIWRATAAFVFAVSAVPTAVFWLLIGLGALRPLPGAFGWLLCLATLMACGLILHRDLAVLTRLFENYQSSAPIPDEVKLLLPGLRGLGERAIGLVKADRLRRERLTESAAADRALVERLPDPLLKLNEAGELIWRNAGAATAFGFETSALLRHPELRAALAEAARLAAPVRRSIAQAAPVPRELDITVIPVGGPIFVLLTDRTGERNIEKMRADFIANASHELRTPLASLIGFIETLRGAAADDPDAQHRFLGIMAEQGMRMQRVIADLLSLSRIETVEHQPPEEFLHLPPLLERIAAGMEPMLAANGAKLELAVPPDLPGIAGDADQLAQVLTNLLDNAIKYGRRGGLIRLSAAAAGADPRLEPNGVVIAVADQGQGIPRVHIPRLTERFYRVDKGRSRAVGGTGLGLAIVKHVVNRHRGRLLIDSVEGKGTTFTVWLPIRQQPISLAP